MLFFNDGEVFTTGVCNYRFRPASVMDRTPRIMVPVKVEGISTEAAVDTGGIYLICPPHIAELIGFDPDIGAEDAEVRFRGVLIRGTLHKINLQLEATDGDSCDLQVTALMPSPNQLNDWDGLPIFLGMQNCLEVLRFAIEPAPEDDELGNFHFAPVWP